MQDDLVEGDEAAHLGRQVDSTGAGHPLPGRGVAPRGGKCWHLLGREATSSSGPLIAYARLVPPGLKFAEPSIGRVLTASRARRSGAGRELMREAVARVRAMWPGHPIRIGAQRYLERFYGEFGFVQVSEPYDEDGIPHIEMLRPA